MHTMQQLLAQARSFYASGDDAAAKAQYLEVLKLDPCELNALSELGALALASGHRSAARTAYLQAVHCHPGNPTALVNLGNLELQDEGGNNARAHFEAALRLDANLPEAHQGLGRVLMAQGEFAAAERHFRIGFTGHALLPIPFRGQGAPIRVLLLVSTHFGNVSTREFLDDRTFEILVVYVEYFDATQSLPPHDLVFNAIGDAELCGDALQAAQRVLKSSGAPLINAPARVLETTRVENAQRLGSLAGVVAAATRRIRRGDLPRLLAERDTEFPMLIRSPGFHMGSHFIQVQSAEELLRSAAGLPGDELLLMAFLDAHGADGMTRKYRVMIIGGQLYPLHLAISANWKVHYFSAAMASEPAFRDEERRFLEDMPAAVGAAGIQALLRIGAALGLDYAGVDFGLRADGAILLFEANATMVIAAPSADAMWDYRRAAIERARGAAVQLIRTRAGIHPTVAKPA
jgi:glutathione synthase/RimK-type ligase-like ATP-grasp enzyme